MSETIGFLPNQSANAFILGESEELSPTLRTDNGVAVAFRKTAHPRTKDEGQGWEHTDTADTLNLTDIGEMRTPVLVVDEL